MSVLVKGMEMPKSCMNCMFCGFAGANCELDTCLITGNAQKHIPHSKMPDCPLVPIPPHGRLIDADELEVQDGWLRDSKYFAQESSHTHITFVYSSDIYNAPTVIPADKDGEDNG